MPRLDLKPQFEICLDSAEFRLVQQALVGRLRPEDQPAATMLGEALANLRAKATDNVLRGNERLKDNLVKDAAGNQLDTRRMGEHLDTRG